jgi:hypothetical protein
MSVLPSGGASVPTRCAPPTPRGIDSPAAQRAIAASDLEKVDAFERTSRCDDATVGPANAHSLGHAAVSLSFLRALEADRTPLRASCA